MRAAARVWWLMASCLLAAVLLGRHSSCEAAQQQPPPPTPPPPGITCPLGKDLCGGKCVSTFSNPAACGTNCTRCQGPKPAGSGSAVCIKGACSVSCSRGYERRGSTSTCRVCGKGFYKPAAGRGTCIRCPGGTTTTGNTAADHDESSDCVPGGLIPAGKQTGASLEKLMEFQGEWIRALNNTGGRGGGRGGSRGGRSGAKACLYDCDGLNQSDQDIQTSRHVAHLAGSPLIYSSNNPADVFAGVNLVGAVRDQRQCATCVSHAIVSAATSAVAAALGIDARQISMSHVFAYFCGHVFKPGSLQQSCSSGWSFKDALQLAGESPGVFFVNETCLNGVDIQTAALSNGALVKPFCLDAASRCPKDAFKCASSRVSEGIVQIQREIRRQGAVMTRILVDSAFKNFFQRNPTGIFNGSTAGTDPSNGIYHAVLLVGYDNNRQCWLALNSWGESWGDKGLFRIAYGVADVGHPEDTYSLTDCFTTSTDPANVETWSRPRIVSADPSAPGCYLYTAVAKDSISGIADHFQVDVLRLVQDNVAGGVIPLKQSPSTGRQEPQLQPPSGSWEGTTFRVCGIPESIFDRVVLLPERKMLLQQRNALLAFKAAVNPSGMALSDWQAGDTAAAASYCNWTGIACDDTGRYVSKIQLQDINLGGELPPDSVWLQLPLLSHVNLISTNIGGLLPPRLHELPQLVYFAVAWNRMSSSLPAEWGAWSHVQELLLYGNSWFGALPASWGGMTSLYHLGIKEGTLSGTIPQAWAGMTSMQRFILADNRISGSIPGDVISKWTQLRDLWLWNNQLTGVLPEELGDMPALEKLDVALNSLSGGILMLSRVRTLKAWTVRNNQFQGNLPSAELWPAADLYYINAGANMLSGELPASYARLSSLQELYLGANQLQGSIPLSWGPGMTALKMLVLSDNSQMTGCVPKEFEGRPIYRDNTGIGWFCGSR